MPPVNAEDTPSESPPSEGLPPEGQPTEDTSSEAMLPEGPPPEGQPPEGAQPEDAPPGGGGGGEGAPPGGNGNGGRQRRNGRDGSQPPWLATTLYILLATFALVAITWVAWVMVQRMQGAPGSAQTTVKPEYSLTVILIVGVGALLVFLTIMVAIFRALRITKGPAPPAALGLPEGSIRAVIALILILIFAIQAVFLYANLSTARYSQLPGLTQQQVDAIPGSVLVSIKEEPAGSGRYVVTIREEKSQDSIDFAKQVLTVVGTLVVAVAGFYFGSQTSGTTVEAMNEFATTLKGPGAAGG